MRLETQSLGVIEYQEKDVLIFEEGLPGFEDEKSFVLVINDEEGLPFHHLQSTTDSSLTFIVTSPFLFIDNYDFELPDEVVEQLEIHSPEDLFIYSVVTVPKKVEFTTINLTAPIVVNTRNNRCKQVILVEKYETKYKIFHRA